MKIFIFLILIIIAILFLGKSFISTAKRNLFKDQAAWSGKEIKIKHSMPAGASESKVSENYLKIIADESKNYLEDEFNKTNN